MTAEISQKLKGQHFVAGIILWVGYFNHSISKVIVGIDNSCFKLFSDEETVVISTLSDMSKMLSILNERVTCMIKQMDRIVNKGNLPAAKRELRLPDEEMFGIVPCDKCS